MNESKKIRVLVAEDEETFQKILTTVLESTGRFEVYPCDSGEEATEALKQSQFDVVILDHVMSGMTGLNVLQLMHEQKSPTPVIVLTGAGSENIAVEAMKLGAYDYLRKDQFDRNHFPIIVYGVYERFLFKKEKEQRERNIAALSIIRNTILTFSEIVQAAVAKLAFLTDEGELAFKPRSSREGKSEFAEYVRKVREELETLAFAVRAIDNLPKSAEKSSELSQISMEQPEKVLAMEKSAPGSKGSHSS